MLNWPENYGEKRIIMGSDKVSLRNVKKADIELIFKWRNSPKVRQMMFNSEPLDHGKHVEFWDKKLKTKELCYIIEDEGEAVGIVRLDKRDDAFEVDIIVDPKQNGKGFGTAALKAITRLATEKGIRKLLARIKEENVASKKAFEKANFKLKHTYYEWDNQ